VEAVVTLEIEFNDPYSKDGYDFIEPSMRFVLSELQIIARESQYQFVGKTKLKYRDINVCENRTDIKRIEAWIE
jgi:hypothetical protein